MSQPSLLAAVKSSTGKRTIPITMDDLELALARFLREEHEDEGIIIESLDLVHTAPIKLVR
jgi:hypothetical protein